MYKVITVRPKSPLAHTTVSFSLSHRDWCQLERTNEWEAFQNLLEEVQNKHNLHSPIPEDKVNELRAEAKLVTGNMMLHGYTYEEAEMFCSILKEEILKCSKNAEGEKFKSVEGLMKCPKCGKEMPVSYNFCKACGKKLKNICAWCWRFKKSNYACGMNSCADRRKSNGVFGNSQIKKEVD